MSNESYTFVPHNQSNTDSASDEVISYTIKFWVYLIVLIPSIICSLFYLYHIFVSRILRNALHNRVITIVLIIGLIYQITIYPWMLYFYHNEGIWHRSAVFCTVWSFIDWPLYFTQTIFFAWATIERHILIFHDRWISTKRKRFFVHYLPLIILLIYCLVFYIIATIFPSCENVFDDNYMICIAFCFTGNHVVYMWDAIVNQTLPNLIIAIFSIALLQRVLRRKHRVRQLIQWRKHRKMTIQLLSISVLYFIFAFPLTLMNLMYLCCLPAHVATDFYEYVLFFNYLMLLFLPFVCVLSLPELRKRMKIFKVGRSKRTVALPT